MKWALSRLRTEGLLFFLFQRGKEAPVIFLPEKKKNGY